MLFGKNESESRIPDEKLETPKQRSAARPKKEAKF
jgi:hypothetical protein